MTESDIRERCRLVLIVPEAGDAATVAARVGEAVAGGDVASVFVPRRGLDDQRFQALAEALAEPVQSRGVALVVEGDSRIAMRAGADGLYFEGPRQELRDLLEKHGRKLMIGTGGVKTRHDALEAGEAQPDFMFFGRFGYDARPEAHPRNLALAGWWSQMVAIPCIAMAGSSEESILDVAISGAEFVAVEQAVFAGGGAPGAIVARLNAMLDERAPRLED